MEQFPLKDRFAVHLGMEIVERRPGYAKVTVGVTERFLNGLSFAHGGVIFSAADYAFALASNSSQETALAINISMNFIKAAVLGDDLCAEAKQISRSRRLGVYHGNVVNQKGETLAQFQSMAYFQEVKSAAVPAAPSL